MPPFDAERLPQNPDERAAMLTWIRRTPLVYGPWRDFKRGFKTVEAAALTAFDPELCAAFIGRIDAMAPQSPDPTQPTLSGSFSTPTLCGDVLLSLDTSQSQRGLRLLDASRLGEPEMLAFLPIANASSLAASGNLAVVGCSDYQKGGVAIIDISDSRRPIQTAFVTLQGISNVALHGNLLCIQGYANGYQMVLLDVSNPSAPIELGRYNGDYGYSLALSGTFAFIGDSNGVTVVDLSDPSKPQKRDKLLQSRNYSPFAMTADAQTLYVLKGGYDNKAKDAGLHLFDVETPSPSGFLARLMPQAGATMPRALGFLPIPDGQSFAVAGDRVFVHRSSGTMLVIDISDRANPKIISKSRVSRPQSFDADGERLFVGRRDGLQSFYVSPEGRLHLQGPSERTREHMKRRGRRLLRHIARETPTSYAEFACDILIEALANRDTIAESALSSRDILFGSLLRKPQPKFVLRRRLERAPELWDARPDLALRLWNHPHLPAAVSEAALKMLRANSVEVPAPDAAKLGRWVRNAHGLLLSLATREVARQAARSEMDAETAALAWYRAGQRTRRELWSAIEARVANVPAWKRQFAGALASRLQSELAGGALTARRIGAARLLARYFADALDGDLLLPLLPVLLGSGDASLYALGLDAVRAMPSVRVPDVLASLSGLSDATREEIVGVLERDAARHAFDAATGIRLVRAANDTERQIGWRLLAASRTEAAVSGAVWADVWRDLRFQYDGSSKGQSRYTVGAALQSALDFPSALDVLARSIISESGFNWYVLNPKSYNVWVSPQVFGALALTLTPATTLRLIGEVPAVTWYEWMSALEITLALALDKWADLWQFALTLDAKDTGRTRFTQSERLSALGARVVRELPFEKLAGFVAGVTDQAWTTWRALLLERLQTPEAIGAFWTAALKAARDDASGNFATRFIADDAIARTFATLPDAAFLEVLPTGETAFEPLLIAWLDAHRDEIRHDHPAILPAATHLLPGVRAWGLKRLGEIELSVPLALRLMEVEFPQTVEAGRAFFEAVPAGDEREEDYALALCDSPHSGVRDWGLGFVERRAARLLSGTIGARLLARLCENFHINVQTWLAARLQTDAPNLAPRATAHFDRAVLRARNRARGAKEAVKARQTLPAPDMNAAESATPTDATPDTTTLLELARSGTPRDAEWALRQLAILGLQGQNIESVEVGGSVAI